MGNERDKSIHHLHVEVPDDLWNELQEVIPEKGMKGIIVRRLLRAYITAVKEARTAIDMRGLIL